MAEFCPNLRKLSIGFKSNELETMRKVFDCCQYLESIIIWCGDDFLSEIEALEMVTKYSPKFLHELKFYYLHGVQDLRLELESTLISWSNRVPSIPLSLIFQKFRLKSIGEENMKLIKKYINLGVIKKIEYF